MELNHLTQDEVRIKTDKYYSSSSIEEKSKSKSKSKKKKMKKEKRKKKSKKKKRKHRESSSDDGSSDSDDNQWVEKVIQQPSSNLQPSKSSFQKPLEREEWMSLPGIFPTISNERKKDKDSKSKKSEEEKYLLDNLGQNERELNPHWKNGGSGLPEIQEASNSTSQLMDVNWLKKSLQRAKEKAEEEGIPLEEVAVERWGSLDTILSMIHKAENSSNYSHGLSSHHDRRNHDNWYKSRDHNSRREKPREWEMERKERPTFKRPRGDDHFPSSSSRRDSNAPKKWQKPKVREKQLQDKLQSSANEIPPSKEIKNPVKETSTEMKNCEDDILTEAELNKLGAQIVKAEIMGNDDLAATLKLRLQKARDLRKLESAKEIEHRVILTRTDSKGITRPLEPRAESSDFNKDRRKRKMMPTHVGGERVRYFADDDKYSLSEMFQHEKGRSSKEDDEMFAKLVSKNQDMDELFEQNITYKDADAKQDARDRSQAIKEHQRKSKSLDNCLWCFESQRMLKHLVIAVGSKVYLSLPPYSSLTVGHCIISPLDHVLCQTQLDEDVFAEIKLFKKTLTKMFAAQGKIPVFFEVATHFNSYPHMQLICVPLSLDEGTLAPMYFKKALLECETEWSNNKKVVDLKDKDIQKAIPKGLPYFEVDFGNHAGFAHVIENEKLFPKNFAQEIIGGMLDVDYSLWRKPKKENFEEQSKKVIDFSKNWQPYDFTGGRSLSVL